MAPAAARRHGVVGAAVLRQGFTKRYGGGGGVGEGEGGTKRKGKKSSISPTIYRRAKGEEQALGDPISLGAAAKGGFPPPQGT